LEKLTYYFRGVTEVMVYPEKWGHIVKNSSDPAGFPLKATELLTWHIFPIFPPAFS